MRHFQPTIHSLHQESHQDPQMNSDERTIDNSALESTELHKAHEDAGVTGFSDSGIDCSGSNEHQTMH